MLRYAVLAAGLLILPSSAFADSRLDFVRAYVRSLSANERIRVNAEKELKSTQNAMADCVRSSELFQLELGADISSMQNIKLTGRLSDVPQNISDLFAQKSGLYMQMGEMCGQMVAGPRPGIDYSKIAADMPKITARLEFIDRALFEASPLVFASIISDVPDKQGHVSRLVITKAERAELVRTINLTVPNVDGKGDLPLLVSAISVVKSYLTQKGYTSADE